MKQSAILIFVVLFFSQCSNKFKNFELKDYKSIEKVGIGMPLNAAIELMSKTYYIEKTKFPAYEGEAKTFEYIIYSDESKKETLFSFNGGSNNLNKDKVFRLVIRNSKYHTKEGICIGMTVADLKEKTELKSAYFNLDDGLFLISNKFDGGYLMELDTSKKYKNFDYEKPQIKTLPADLKIKEIIIF